jgi:hypothetical protein
MAEGVRAVQNRVGRTVVEFLAKENYETTRISFQFLGGSIRFSTLSQMSAKSQLDVRDYKGCHHLWDALATRLPSLSQAEDPPWLVARLFEVSAALRFRTTARDVDEPTCIALLLGIPTTPITILDTASERMKELYLCIQKFPPNIIFAAFQPPILVQLSAPSSTIRDNPAGQEQEYSRSSNAITSQYNLDISGFRWAPRSFLGHFPGLGQGEWVYGRPGAHCDAAGLHGEYFSFVFELQDRREPIQEKKEDAPTYSLYDALTSPRLVLEDEDSRRRYQCLEIRSRCRDEELVLPSLDSPFPTRGAILYNEEGEGRFEAILGRVLDGSSESPFGTPAKKDLSSSGRRKVTGSELVFHPLANGRFVSNNFRLPSWYAQRNHPTLVLQGHYLGWGKWCIT